MSTLTEEYLDYEALDSDSYDDCSVTKEYEEESENFSEVIQIVQIEPEHVALSDNDSFIIREENETEFVVRLGSNTEFESHYSEIDEEAENDSVDELCNKGKNYVPEKPKTRQRNPELWKQNIRKNLREKGLPYISSKGVEMPAKSVGPTCALTCLYSCSKNISNKTRQRIHEHFWSLTYEEKLLFYQNFIKRTEVKRRRAQSAKTDDPKKKNSFQYFFQVKNRTVQVCKKYFLNTLDISSGAIFHFLNKHTEKKSLQSFPNLSIRGKKQTKSKQDLDAVSLSDDGLLIEDDEESELVGNSVDSSIVKGNKESEFGSCANLNSDTEADSLKIEYGVECELDNEINNISENVCSKPKTRTRNPEKWKQNIRIKQREKGLPYISSNGVEMPGKSMGPTCALTCPHSCTTKISTKNRKLIYQNFWNLTTEEKYMFYNNFVKRTDIKRRRPHCNKENDPRKKNSYQYYFKVKNRTIQVCKKYFLNTLAISAGLLSHYFAKHCENGAPDTSPKLSNRGRKGFSEDQIHEVKNHIQSFPTVKSESCYPSCTREYFESHLNVTRMYNQYKETASNPVGLQFYRDIFKKYFNYSFNDPKKDICENCNV